VLDLLGRGAVPDFGGAFGFFGQFIAQSHGFAHAINIVAICHKGKKNRLRALINRFPRLSPVLVCSFAPTR
jgi:hypothetical protein